MANYIFSNLIGSFVFDEKFKVKDSIIFGNLKDYEKKKEFEEKLIKKYKDLKNPDNSELKKILPFFKNKKYFSDFSEKNFILTKKQIKDSVNEDFLIIQTINNIEEIKKVTNILMMRLREWYELHNPEFSKSMFDNEKFVELILSKTKKQLLKEIDIKEDESMGASFTRKELDPIKNLAKQVIDLYNLIKVQGTYLENIMKKYCPNLNEIAGVVIGALLLEHTGSLKKLMEMPASTIQILGAEKALFRHLKSHKKSKPPKYGLLSQHPFIGKVSRDKHGKVARTLADKISIAVKVDYFKGKFIGDKLNNEIKKKFDIN